MNDARDTVGTGEGPRGHDAFVSYSRADRGVVTRIVAGLDERGVRSWVDLQDIPPSAEWMAEIRGAIDAADGCLVVISPDLARSPVCAEELNHAKRSGKRIVPLLVRKTDPETLPEIVSSLNWIDATDASLDGALDDVVTALRTNLDRARAHSRLLVRATEWEGSDADRSLVLRGRELTDAEQILTDVAEEPRPTPLQTRFVIASREAASRRQRAGIGAVAAVLALSLVLSAVALAQRSTARRNEARAERQADIANSRSLAIQSRSAIDEDLALGVLLSIEAARVAQTEEAGEAMHVSAQTSVWVDRILRAGEGPMFSTAFSGDGAAIAAGGADGSLTVWRLDDGQRTFSAHAARDGISAVEFMGDSSRLVTGSIAGEMAVWDLVNEERADLPDLGSAIEAIATADGSPSVAVGTDDGTVRIIDVDQAQLIAGPVDPGLGSVRALAFEPGGRALAVVGTRGRVATIDVQSGRVTERSTWTAGSVASAAFAPTLGTVALGGIDGTIGVREAVSGRPVTEIDLGSGVEDLAFSPDGMRLASTSRDSVSQIWDARTGASVGGPLPGREGSGSGLSFSPDGTLLAAAGGTTTGSVAIWTSPGVRSPGATTEPGSETVGGAPGEIVDVDLAPDGSIAFADGELKIVSPRSGGNVTVVTPVHPEARTWRLAYSPDGSLVATGNTDGTITRWDAVTGEPLGASLRRGLSLLVDVEFSPDGRLLVGASNAGQIVFWDADTGKPAGRSIDPEEPAGALPGHEAVFDVAFSHDGGLLASGGPDGTVRLWQTDTRKQMGPPLELPGTHNESWKVAFSPDDALIASGNVDGSVVVWDVDDRSVVRRLQGHTAPVPGLSFSRDGSTLATGSLDGTVALWNTSTWAQIGESIPALGNPWAVEFAPDDSVLASAGAAGVYLRGRSAWTTDIAELRARLCLVAGRNLTRTEWAKYLPFEPFRLTCQAPVPSS